MNKDNGKFYVLITAVTLFTVCSVCISSEVPMGNGKLPEGTSKVQTQVPKPTLSPSKNLSYPKTDQPPIIRKVSNNPTNTAANNEDWSAYMRNLQKSVRMNWDPPKSDVTHRVTLKFRILKNGHVQYCNVYKTSGNSQYDKAAVSAIKSTKFDRLPYNKQFTDIQFTFDYNVFGAERIQ